MVFIQVIQCKERRYYKVLQYRYVCDIVSSIMYIVTIRQSLKSWLKLLGHCQRVITLLKKVRRVIVENVHLLHFVHTSGVDQEVVVYTYFFERMCIQAFMQIIQYYQLENVTWCFAITKNQYQCIFGQTLVLILVGLCHQFTLALQKFLWFAIQMYQENQDFWQNLIGCQIIDQQRRAWYGMAFFLLLLKKQTFVIILIYTKIFNWKVIL
eukprot:TRINITY_DN4014_c0_g1_i5.p3 TRINITY_DN4014_c0_g1~~TRINITY_DN4014_c0_g1_i5.p3  ORF type:complete len:210 (-),score=-9.26 TRINITY_DN4014_c0_g1_i5:1004-1633(-)